ncbi:MAG: hypothetical protein MR051_09365, partial [Lentisphaeria bacterium]|nr:hypothetical protein [Lentisphaeria bacterium]
MSEYSSSRIYSSVSGITVVTVNDDIFTGEYIGTALPATLSGDAAADRISSTGHSALNAGHYGIKDSLFSGNLCASAGGALRNDGTGLTISGTTFTGGSSGSLGGAIYTSGSPVTISDSKFVGNISAKAGGAIYHGGPNLLTIKDSLFQNNCGNNENSGDGAGAVNVASGGVEISGSTFCGNTSAIARGAVYVGAGVTAKITDTLFSGNTCATDKGWQAAGLFTRGQVELSGVTFSDAAISVFATSAAAVTVKGRITLGSAASRIWVQPGGTYVIDGDSFLTGGSNVAQAVDAVGFSSSWNVAAAPTTDTDKYQLFYHNNDLYVAAKDA